MGLIYKGIKNTKFGIENSIDTKNAEKIKHTFYLEKDFGKMTIKSKIDTDKKFQISLLNRLYNKISIGMNIDGYIKEMNNEKLIRNLLAIGLSIKYEE